MTIFMKHNYTLMDLCTENSRELAEKRKRRGQEEEERKKGKRATGI